MFATGTTGAKTTMMATTGARQKSLNFKLPNRILCCLYRHARLPVVLSEDACGCASAVLLYWSLATLTYMTSGAGVMGAAGATMVDTTMATVIMARATAVRPNIKLHLAGVTS